MTKGQCQNPQSLREVLPPFHDHDHDHDHDHEIDHDHDHDQLTMTMTKKGFQNCDVRRVVWHNRCGFGASHRHNTVFLKLI